MRFFYLFILGFCCMAFRYNPESLWTNSKQVIVVTSADWNASQGILKRYEKFKDQKEWQAIGPSIRVELGKNGMAWGIGLHHNNFKKGPLKVEGDNKTPAGIFRIGSGFGFAPAKKMKNLKINYISIGEDTEAVDDPLSKYYNRIVNRNDIPYPDWCSSEIMLQQDPYYSLGFEIHHNYPNPLPGAGSAIFFHVYDDEWLGTHGCTAMSKEDMQTILFWLDKSKNPILVQVPVFCQPIYGFPQLNE